MNAPESIVAGLGLSSGEKAFNPVDMARDAHDLIEALAAATTTSSFRSRTGTR